MVKDAMFFRIFIRKKSCEPLCPPVSVSAAKEAASSNKPFSTFARTDAFAERRSEDPADECEREIVMLGECTAKRYCMTDWQISEIASDALGN